VASSTKYAGIVEKSVEPIIGLFIFTPFHNTCVCEGDVPRKATVESDARPELLTYTAELKLNTSAIESEMVCLNEVLSIWLFVTPTSLIGRLPNTEISSIS
jgi:hypothetical protein